MATWETKDLKAELEKVHDGREDQEFRGVDFVKLIEKKVKMWGLRRAVREVLAELGTDLGDAGDGSGRVAWYGGGTRLNALAGAKEVGGKSYDQHICPISGRGWDGRVRAHRNDAGFHPCLRWERGEKLRVVAAAFKLVDAAELLGAKAIEFCEDWLIVILNQELTAEKCTNMQHSINVHVGPGGEAWVYLLGAHVWPVSSECGVGRKGGASGDGGAAARAAGIAAFWASEDSNAYRVATSERMRAFMASQEGAAAKVKRAASQHERLVMEAVARLACLAANREDPAYLAQEQKAQARYAKADEEAQAHRDAYAECTDPFDSD